MGLPQRSTPIGTVQRPWKRRINKATGFCTNNSGTFNASTYVHKIALPTTSLSAGIFVIEPDVCNQIVFNFWGAAAAATFVAYIYALIEAEAPEVVRPVSQESNYREYCGEHIGTLTPTLGATGIESGSLIYPVGTVFAESVAITVNKVYSGWTAYSEQSTGASRVVGDFLGSTRLLIALKTGGSATGMGFDWREA